MDKNHTRDVINRRECLQNKLVIFKNFNTIQFNDFLVKISLPKLTDA